MNFIAEDTMSLLISSLLLVKCCRFQWCTQGYHNVQFQRVPVTCSSTWVLLSGFWWGTRIVHMALCVYWFYSTLIKNPINISVLLKRKVVSLQEENNVCSRLLMLFGPNLNSIKYYKTGVKFLGYSGFKMWLFQYINTTYIFIHIVRKSQCRPNNSFV